MKHHSHHLQASQRLDPPAPPFSLTSALHQLTLVRSPQDLEVTDNHAPSSLFSALTSQHFSSPVAQP